MLTAGAMALSASLFSLVSSAIEAVYDGRTVRSTHATAVGELDAKAVESDRKASSLEQKLADSERKRADSDLKLRTQTAELNKLKAEQLVTVNGKQRPLKELVSETSLKVRSIAKNTAIRNVASMPAEGLPLLGIATIVAATTLEIKDACDISTAMQGLDVAMNPENEITDHKELCGMAVPTEEEIWTQIKNSPEAVWNSAKELYATLQDLELPTSYDIWLSIKDTSAALGEYASGVYAGLPTLEEATESLESVPDGIWGAWEGLKENVSGDEESSEDATAP
jgi:hypothetical protein